MLDLCSPKRFAWWIVAFVALGSVTARAEDFTPVVGSILGGDTMPIRGSDGRTHLVYEVLLMNAKAVPATLERVEVLRGASDTAPLAVLAGPALLAALHTLGARPAGSAVIPPNEGRILFVNLGFASAAETPPKLVHRLAGQGAASPAARAPAPLEYVLAPLEIAGRTAPVLQAPLAGRGWVAINGCCSGGGAHRGAIQSVDGRLVDSQRFAIDWMRLDGEGRLFAGDAAKPESYAGYGAPVHAAGAGTVVRAGDDLPDQTPGQLPDPAAITIANVDGNHVVIDHGGSVFTFYAHLRAGSVAVKAGDAVAAGQQIGLLGNSGNTSAPHLHFHAMVGPSPLGSDGIPFEIEAFTVTRHLDGDDLDRLLAGEALAPAASATETVERALPLDLSVVDFGER